MMKPNQLRTRTITGIICLLGVVAVAVPRHAHAVADVPYFANANVEPNIFLAFDSSGSMDTSDIPNVSGGTCASVGCRKRIDIAREVLSGFATPTDTTDTGTSIVDQFGSQVRFVYGRFLTGDTTVRGLSFSGQAGTVDSPYFRNDNLVTLKNLIKNTPTDAWTPSASMLLDVGCWILGEGGMNEGFNKVANGMEMNPRMRYPIMRYTGPGTPFFFYDYISIASFWWPTGSHMFWYDWSQVEVPYGFSSPTMICRQDMRNPHVRPTALTVGTATIPADPAFNCRQTFVIFITDGEQSVGYGQGGRPDMSQFPSWDPDFRPDRLCTGAQRNRILPMTVETSCSANPTATGTVQSTSVPTVTSFRGQTGLSNTNGAYSGATRFLIFTSTSAATAANRWVPINISGYTGSTRQFTLAGTGLPVPPAVGDTFVVVTTNTAAGRLLLPCTIDSTCRLANCPTNPWFNSPMQQKRRGWAMNRVGTDRLVVNTSNGYYYADGRSGHASSCSNSIGTWYENWGPGFKHVLAAMRQSTYLPAGAQRNLIADLNPNPGPGVLTYVIGIAAPTDTLLRMSNDGAARFGGTDATPTNPDKCLEVNEDGSESFNAFSADELSKALQKAIQCIIRGTATRAAPAFIVSGAGFSSSQEVNAYFEVTYQSLWWMGHLVSFTFGEITRAAEAQTAPIPEFDAGQLLTNRTTERNIFISTNPIQSPVLKNPANRSLGAHLGAPIDPVEANEVIPFKTPYASQIQPMVSGADEDEVEDLIEFLRDEDGPANNVIKFFDGSSKTWALGPIVNSTPVIVEPPFFDPLLGGNNEKYIQFINDNEIRPTMVYVGANDGFMHGFVLEDPLRGIPSATNILEAGYELFAFMPREAARRMKEMKTGVVFSVDGQISVANVQFLHDITTVDDDTFHTVLIGGLRSGGHSYYGLDVTDPRSPTVLWEVTHPNMARSFAKPNINRFKVQDDPNDVNSAIVSRWLFAVGGGFNAGRTDDGDNFTINPSACAFYTTDEDCFSNVAKTTVFRPAPDPVDDPAGYAAACPGGPTPEALCVDGTNTVIVNPPPPLPGQPDPGLVDVGNWVFVFDVERGLLYQDIRIADLASDPRRNSIPGDLLLLDRSQNGFVDNIIFGDVEGRLWKTVVKSPDPEKWVVDANNNGGLDPTDSPCVMFDPANPGYFNPAPPFIPARRPIFYAPSATMDCNGDINFFFGTGDQTRPNETTSTDYLYALKDRNSDGCGVGMNSTFDFECPAKGPGEVFGLSTTQAQYTREAFPMKLPNPGEKILSSPVVFNGEMYVTTFIPGSAGVSGSSGCSPGTSGIIFARAICCNPKLQKADGVDDVLTYVMLEDKLLPPPVRTPQGSAASPTAMDVFSGEQTQAVEESARQSKLSRYFTVLGARYIP